MADQNSKPSDAGKSPADRLAEKNAGAQTSSAPGGGHGISSGLHPGGSIPDSTPGAGLGSLGTGGASTGGAPSGAVKKGDRA
ncbi:hypothetical protein QMO56_05550 [Roseomonas sp. E05]|uniref:hypothetical protein n=1 Tax=Roseomonas sp. E05 TaxID=3046310 RepID=UPI0024BBA14A|nr:hypothetical protein [Roseomonas sp. E05]MDJ0387571.1 hypothetical protein [Roseomonas sp. E05]